MKLESKHLTPYLLYSLKVIMEGKKTNVAWMSTKNIAVIRPDGIGEYKKIPWSRAHLNIKPILRPLSDLTKEIEHQGEKFVPTFKLFEIEYCGTRHVEDMRTIYTEQEGRFLITSHYDTAVTSAVNIVALFNNNYWKMKQLFEWHFDVFGLIPAGLAIDLNTLEL